MSNVPHMQVHALHAFLGAVQAAGQDPERILARVGLTPEELEDAEARIPVSVGHELLDAASEATGDPHFGLHAGAAEEPSTLGAVGYVMLHSPTVAESLFNLCRFLHLVYEGSDLQVHTDPPRAALHYRSLWEHPGGMRHDNEYAIAFAVRLLQLVSEPGWCPEEIWFRHEEPADTSAYRRWLDAPIRFAADVNAVVFDHELLARENPEADANLLSILERHVADLLAERPAPEDLLGCVRAHILRSLPSGGADLQSIASRMATSPRTLQRRLRDEGAHFKTLVEEARHELSVRYLEGTDAPITEIAFMTGYSEVSAFTRAFRRRTGKTPLEFRRRKGA